MFSPHFSLYTLSNAVVLFSVLGLVTSSAQSAPPSGDQIPDFMQQGMMNKQARKAGNYCPQGQYAKWQILWSPASGPSSIPGGEVPASLNQRAFGEIAINKSFAHAFDTKPFSRECCRVKEAWLWMQTSHQDPESPWTGNQYSNGTDIFDTFSPSLTPSNTNTTSTVPVLYPNAPFSGNPQASLPNWNWNKIHLTSDHFQDRWLSYAMADDTNVKRTALVARTCCLNKIKEKGDRANLRKSTNTANKFLQMMKQDKGKVRAPSQEVIPKEFDPRLISPPAPK